MNDGSVLFKRLSHLYNRSGCSHLDHEAPVGLWTTILKPGVRDFGCSHLFFFRPLLAISHRGQQKNAVSIVTFLTKLFHSYLNVHIAMDMHYYASILIIRLRAPTCHSKQSIP